VADRGHRFTEGESVHCGRQRWPTLDQRQNKSQDEIRFTARDLCEQREAATLDLIRWLALPGKHEALGAE